MTIAMSLENSAILDLNQKSVISDETENELESSDDEELDFNPKDEQTAEEDNEPELYETENKIVSCCLSFLYFHM